MFTLPAPTVALRRETDPGSMRAADIIARGGVSGGDGPVATIEVRSDLVGKSKAELQKYMNASLETARNIAKAVDEAGRDFDSTERASVTKAVEDGRAAKNAIAALNGDEAILAELNALGGVAGELAKNGAKASDITMSLGERLTSNAHYTEWLKSVMPSGGSIPDKAKLHSPAVGFGMKDLVTGASDTSAGALVNTDHRGLLDGLGVTQRPLTLADLVTRGQTGSDTVEFARVTATTNAAAPVAEATTTANGTKPESALTLEKTTETVKTVAHWLPATRRALSDAGQIRTLIDNFLAYGLNEELEDQMANGDGTGENMTGILQTSGIQAQAYDTDLLTTARKAKTKVRTVGRARATAYLIHPNDNEAFDLLKSSDGSFYFGGPGGNSSNPMWGLPRVECEAIPEGTALVGDFRTAVLWDREEAAIMATDSHSDFFVKNLIAILAEMRAAFGVIRPAAFVTIDLTP